MGFPELLLRKIAVEPHFADRRFLLAQGNETERDGTDTLILPGDAPSGMLTPVSKIIGRRAWPLVRSSARAVSQVGRSSV
jgi:hypothetical protein